MEGTTVASELTALIERVIGCAIRVHREIGPGYLEAAYERALAIELGIEGIGFKTQQCFELRYRGHQIGEGRIDMVIDQRLVVELKSVDKLAPIHTAQVIAYLKALDLPVGLILNFNTSRLRDGIKKVTHPDRYSR